MIDINQLNIAAALRSSRSYSQATSFGKNFRASETPVAALLIWLKQVSNQSVVLLRLSTDTDNLSSCSSKVFD